MVEVLITHNRNILNVGVNDSLGIFKKGIIKINKLSRKKYLKMKASLGCKKPNPLAHSNSSVDVDSNMLALCSRYKS